MVMLGQNASTRNCSVRQITGKIINGISSSITPCKHTHCLVEYLSAVLIWEIISPCKVLPHSFTRWPARSSAKILLFQHWRKCQGVMLYATLCKVWAHYTVLMVCSPRYCVAAQHASQIPPAHFLSITAKRASHPNICKPLCRKFCHLPKHRTSPNGIRSEFVYLETRLIPEETA